MFLASGCAQAELRQSRRGHREDLKGKEKEATRVKEQQLAFLLTHWKRSGMSFQVRGGGHSVHGRASTDGL